MLCCCCCLLLQVGARWRHCIRLRQLLQRGCGTRRSLLLRLLRLPLLVVLSC
jgi:hypothetical protein